jgi:hypothetical protein
MADGMNPFEAYGQLHPTNDLRSQRLGWQMMHTMDQGMGLPRTHFAGRMGGGGQDPITSTMLAQNANVPDYSQFTYDPGLNAQARSMGITPLSPNQVNPNAIFSNQGFMGAHPRLARMLEGGLFGAAATRGSDTIGEGISNVASGFIEGRQARQGVINRQFEKPFQSYGMLESLRDMKQKRELQESQIQEQRSLADLHKAQIDAVGKGEYHTTPITKGDAGYVKTNTITGETQYVQNPDYDPEAQRKAIGAGTDFDRQVDLVNAERAKKGLPPMNSEGRMQEWQRWNSSRAAGAGEGGLPSKEESKQLDWVDGSIAQKEARRAFAAQPNHNLKDWPDFYDNWKQQKRSEIHKSYVEGKQWNPPNSSTNPSGTATPKKGTGKSLVDEVIGGAGVGKPGPTSQNMSPIPSRAIDLNAAEQNQQAGLMNALGPTLSIPNLASWNPFQ